MAFDRGHRTLRAHFSLGIVKFNTLLTHYKLLIIIIHYHLVLCMLKLCCTVKFLLLKYTNNTSVGSSYVAIYYFEGAVSCYVLYLLNELNLLLENPGNSELE